MNFNELIERAHSQAKSMGWWDEERNIGELLMLIVSECGEALEAHRNGMVNHIGNTPLDHIGIVGTSVVMDRNAWVDEFRSKLKDHMPDELADIAIRIADFMGHQKWGYEEFSLKLESDNVGESLYAVVSNITHYQRPLSVNLCYAVSLVFDLAKRHNIDLWRSVELKLAYNASRGKKHGKAY